MRWSRRAALTVSVTALTVLLMAGWPRGGAVVARIVRVERGEVHCVAALAGRLEFSGGHGVFAPWPGQVAQVYVQPGQRVSAGQALVRMEGDGAERIAAAWAAGGGGAGAEVVQELLAGCMLRAPQNATVRQVPAQAHQVVQAGEMLVALSDAAQVIRCVAAEREARQVQVGMRAAILLDGEEIGAAEVTQVGGVVSDASGIARCTIELTPLQPLPLTQGALVEAQVTLLRRQGVPVLPLEVVTERGTLWWVHDGICTEIPAEIVLSDEMRAWVDLPEGIAVAAGEFREGQKVQEAAP